MIRSTETTARTPEHQKDGWEIRAVSISILAWGRLQQRARGDSASKARRGRFSQLLRHISQPTGLLKRFFAPRVNAQPNSGNGQLAVNSYSEIVYGIFFANNCYFV
jgi:hypothetical protein